MQAAWVTKVTDDLQAAWDYQTAVLDTTPDDPAERDAILAAATDEVKALADTILDAEDDTFVLSATGNGWDDAPSTDATPVWWVPSDEAPSTALLADSSEHCTWEGGYTWPRQPVEPGACLPLTYEPADVAALTISADYTARHEDITNADEAAYTAVGLLLDGPDWLCLVPAHWTAGAWLDAYSVAYADQWRKQLGLNW